MPDNTQGYPEFDNPHPELIQDTREVSAKVSETGTTITFQAPIPIVKDGVRDEDVYKVALERLVEKFGNAVVFSQAAANMVVGAQAHARNRIAKMDLDPEDENHISEEQAIVECEAWKPAFRRPAQPPAEKVKSLLQNMSAEERAELLRSMSEED